MKFSWRGVTPQLFLVVILPLTILLLIITFGGLRLHQQSMRSLVGERDVRAVRAAANALAEEIYHRQSAVQSLALQIDPQARGYDFSATLRESVHLQPDFDMGLAIYDGQYDLLGYQGDGLFWANLDLESMLGSQGLSQAKDPVGMLKFIDIPGQNPAFLIVASSRSGDGIGAGAFSPEGLFQTALKDVINPTVGGYAFVTDQHRRILFELGNRPDPQESLPDHPGVSEALNGKSGSTYIEFGEDEHVIAYSPVQPENWALVIEEPWHIVASPLLRLTEYAPLVLIPILVLALLALWFGTSRIVQPLRSLEGRASALGWGDFDAIEEPVGGIAEIRHLQSELILLAKKVKAAQQSLRGYIGVMTRGLEEERHRLARELHDETMQSLIALNQRVQLSLLSEDHPNTRQGLEEIQKITENTIQELRRVTRALRPIYLEDLGLVAALEMLSRETQQQSGIEVWFQRLGTEQRLREEVELALYRMVQETLSNAVRHAGAKHISIRISFSEQEVTVEVLDDGKGFEVPDNLSAFAPGGHYGLLGLFERAELIGARLRINSNPGEGTRIKVSLPVHSRQ